MENVTVAVRKSAPPVMVNGIIAANALKTKPLLVSQIWPRKKVGNAALTAQPQLS